MADPRFEVASGVIDGVNRVFTVSKPYVLGTTAVFINGQLKRADFDDGWVESDPAAGEVTLDEAPRLLEVVQVFFSEDDGGAVRPGEEVSPLRGRIIFTEEVRARMLVTSDVIGRTAATGTLAGWMIEGDAVLRGQLSDEERLKGFIAEVC